MGALEPRRPPSPAAAYYNQRHAIAASSARLQRMREAIDDPANLAAWQWAQWFAYAREYRPDLVLELGRGNGNSTAAVNEALRQLNHGRLVSFCLRREWQEKTVPRLAPLVEPGWFDRIDARVGDMLLEDFGAVIGDARRVLLIWDAHGFEIASLVLGHILPILAEREHFVIMHDISDLRFRDPGEIGYGGRELWQGMNWAQRNPGSARVYIGWISTVVDQPIAVVDFLTRNRGQLRSADESFHEEIVGIPERLAEMQRVLPPADWNTIGDWAWFSLNGLPEPYTFPRFERPTAGEPAVSESSQIQTVSTAHLLRLVARRLWRRRGRR